MKCYCSIFLAGLSKTVKIQGQLAAFWGRNLENFWSQFLVTSLSQELRNK